MAIVCVCFFLHQIMKIKIIDHWIKYSKCHVICSTDTQNITTMTYKIYSLIFYILIQFICENERKIALLETQIIWRRSKNKPKKIAYFSCACALAHFLFCCSQQYIQSKNWHSPSYTFIVFLFVNACYNLHLIYLYILFV